MTPEARRERLRVRAMGDRIALLDERDGRVHLLNPLSSALWELADGTTSMGRLTQLVATRLGEPTSVDQVERGVADLEAAGLMANRHADVRRRAVLTAAVLAPTVLTIGSPTPAAAAAKVAICHKGSTILVSARAVADHLAHGDTLGACGSATTTTLAPELTTTTTTLAPGLTTTTTLAPDPNPTTTTTLAPQLTTTTTTLAPP